MRRATVSVPLPAMRRRGRRPSGTRAADLGARSEPLIEPGRAGGSVRAWFARGRLGSAPGVEDCRRTGGRC